MGDTSVEFLLLQSPCHLSPSLPTLPLTPQSPLPTLYNKKLFFSVWLWDACRFLWSGSSSYQNSLFEFNFSFSECWVVFYLTHDHTRNSYKGFMIIYWHLLEVSIPFEPCCDKTKNCDPADQGSHKLTNPQSVSNTGQDLCNSQELSVKRATEMPWESWVWPLGSF
jgi:hypothetical protein